MSIHGICFDESMAGRCGLECEGFLTGECGIPAEIIEHDVDNLAKESMGELQYHILDAAGRLTFKDKINAALELYGYKDNI